MLYHQIQFTKGLTKQFKKLRETQQNRFYERLDLFKKNPNDKVLRDHALKGNYKGCRSIDIQGDLRVIYYIKDGRVIIFALIGTHSQLYG